MMKDMITYFINIPFWQALVIVGLIALACIIVGNIIVISRQWLIIKYNIDAKSANMALKLAFGGKLNHNIHNKLIENSCKYLNSVWYAHLDSDQEANFIYLKHKHNLDGNQIQKLFEISDNVIDSNFELIQADNLSEFMNEIDGWNIKAMLDGYAQLSIQSADQYQEVLRILPYCLIYLPRLVNDDIFYDTIKDELIKPKKSGKIINLNDYR